MRYNVTLRHTSTQNWRYDNCTDVRVEQQALWFKTEDGKLVITTFRYLVEEIK